MYRQGKRTAIETAQEKAKAVLRLKQSLIKALKELHPDGLLSKEEIFKELEEFKVSVAQLADDMEDKLADDPEDDLDEDDDN